MTDTPHTAAQGFNFDAFMYGVRRDSPFDGSTLADSISNDEVRRAESAFNSLLKRAEKAEAELAALKGDQVPVAKSLREDILRCVDDAMSGVHDSRAAPDYAVRVAAWVTAPQKPVVLLPPAYEKSDDFTEYHQGWNACRNYMLAEAKEAGGIVKDGE